ncbi:MAG: hypothetical protein QM656_11805 [Paracoccaceae bacterium]
MRIAPAIIFALLGAAAQAGDLVDCQTSIRGQALHFVYDPAVPALRDSRSWRERNFGDWGAVSCPGLVTLRAMTPELDDAGRAPFCLQWDRRAGTYIGYAEGERDAWLGCQTPSRSFCERVNGSRQAAGQIAGQALDMAQVMTRGGLALSQHPSGAMVLNGPGRAVGDQLAAFGASALAGVSSPAVMAGVAVTAVAVGGAVYVCSDEGAEGAAVEAAAPTRMKDGAEVTGLPGADLLGADLPVGTEPAPPVPAAD